MQTHFCWWSNSADNLLMMNRGENLSLIKLMGANTVDHICTTNTPDEKDIITLLIIYIKMKFIENNSA